MSAENKRTKRVMLYLPDELNKAIDKIVENSIVGEKKNTIILKCLIAGLKTEYNTDINN